MSNFIDAVKRKVKIADVLRERGVLPSRSYAGKLIYKCPIHKGDNSPSFYVYEKDSGDDFFCYGCKAGGNVIHLVKHMNNCTGKEALKTVSDIAGVEIDPYFYTYDLDCYLESPEASAYDIDSILRDATMAFRSFRSLSIHKKVDSIDSHWKVFDESYWASNTDKAREVSKWMLGR